MRNTTFISLLLILVFGFGGSLFAQTLITVGEGTDTNTTTGTPTPYGTFYKNFRQQYLILATELENAGGGTGNINSIAFNVDNVNTCVAMPNFTIKLKHTTQTVLTTTFETGEYTTVWSAAEFLPVVGWNTHTFTTPFNWNGSSNIIVDIITTLIPGAYTQNASVFYTPTTYNSCLRYQSDSVDASTATTGTLSMNRANIRFNMASIVITDPPNPANLVSPANGATLVNLFSTLNWSSGGGLPTGYRLSFGTNNPPTDLLNNQDLGLVNSYDPPGNLTPATTYYWKVVPYNANGNAANCPVWSFTTHGDPTVTTLPYSQNWDLITPPALPFDWTSIYQSTTTTGYVRTVTTTPHTTPNCVAMYNSSDIATTAILVGPEIGQNLNMNSIRVKLWGKGGTNYHLFVGVMTNPTDPATFTMVEDLTVIANWNEYVVDFTTYTGAGRYIAFKHGNFAAYHTLYVDEITYEPIDPNDLGATTITGNATPSVGAATTYTIGLRNWGTAAQSTYTVKLMSGTTELASVAGPAIAAGATGSAQVSWTPTTQGPMTIFGKVVLTGDVNPANDNTSPMAITVQPQGIISVTIGDGSANARMPFDFYYRNSLYETLYYPDEIGMFGNITSLTLYNNFFTTTLTSMPAKIWMGTTTQADLSGGWIPATDLTLVFDGNLAFPGGENTITFPLMAPFTYSGGNLVVLFNRPMDTVYYSSSDYFKCQTVGTNRARNIYSDSVTYDPAAPGTVGTVTGQFPKTTLTMTPLSPDPIFSITPPSYNFNTVLMNTTNDKLFRIMNAGGGTLTVSTITIGGSPHYTLQNMPTLPVNLTTGQSATFVVRYNPTAAGNHTATVTITDNRMPHTVAISGTSLDATIYNLPYAQAFDTVTPPALPVDWSSIYQATVTTGYVKTVTTSPQSTPNCVAMYNPTDINTIAMLIAPPLANTIATNTVRVKFWGKGTNYAVKVGVMTNPADPATFVEVQTITLAAAWAQYSVPLTTYAGTGKFIAFKHANNAAGQTIYLDTIDLEPISPNDLAALTLTGNTTPSVGNETPYTVTVFNNGTANQSAYSVKLFNSQNVELATAAGVPVNAGQQVDVIVTWTPATEGAQIIYGKVVLAGDANPNNDQTPNMNITVMPAGIISITIGDGSVNARMPLDFFYRNSLYETIYYPNEIGMIGNIITLSIYNQFTTTTLTSMPTKIWMGITQQADLSAGWIPSTELTLVYDGSLAYPSGANTITYPLLAPFPYTGGNLVVMFNRPMDTTYYSSSDYFKCQTVGTNRARNMYSDSIVYDPTAPETGTLTGQFPKTTLVMTPMGGDPLFMINPTSKDFGTVLLNSTHNQNFSIMNAGGGTLTINTITISGSPMFSLQNMPTLPANLSTGQTALFTSRYNPTAAGQHAATITITDNLNRSYTINVGRSEKQSFSTRDSANRTPHTVALTGTCIDTTINTLPYLQAFDALTVPALPVDWLKLVQSTATALVQTYTTTPHSAPNTAGMTNSTDTNATAILIAPPLGTAIPTNTTRVKFWARSGGAAYPLGIGIMSDALNASTFIEIQSIALTTTWTEYVVSFAGYTGTGKHVAFKHGLGGTSRLLYIDDVMIEVTPTNDLAATSIAGNATPSVGAPSIYNVAVYNWGTAAQNTYNVKIYNAAGTELATAAGVAIAPGASVQVPVSWTPTTEGSTTIFAKVVLATDQNNLNDQTPNLTVLVLPSGIFAVTVGDGSQNARVPVDMYWKNSMFETLYYPAELGNFMGQITGIQFYNNFITNLPNMPTKVWFGTTTQTDLSAGWIPSTNLTLVFDGTVNYPSGENLITIPFNNNFMYLNGENLVLLVNRPMDTQYYSSSDYFKAQTDATNTARARNVSSDTTTYDPAAPPTTGTPTGQFPKTTFLGIPGGVGHLNGTVLGVGNQPLADVAVQITNTTYSTTTNAQGMYVVQNILPANYTVTFTKYGYNTHTANIVLEEDETETLNVTMQPMAQVNMSGTILASDTGAGLSGVTIHLVGYQNYDGNTAANGTFTIPGVYANQSYAYTFIRPGYTTITGTVNVGATNHNMGSITMNEVAYAPFGVVAALNDTQTQVNLTWQAPDPTAVNITESFESATFPPTGWTQVITNTGPINPNGVYPTWCSFGTTTYNATPAAPTDGVKQAGLWWSYDHQDEWLITQAFNCPPAASLYFTTLCYRGSPYNDHYYVKCSTDGGINWTVLWDATTLTGGYTPGATPINIGLEQYGGQQIKIAFHAEDPPSNNGLWYGWYIDNILIGNPTTTIRFNPEEMEVRSAQTPEPEFTLSDPGMSRDSKVSGFVSSLDSVRGGVSGEGRIISRVLTGYKVWRLLAGQETNPNVWTALTAEPIIPLTYIDSGWNALPNGTYRWAIKAIYTSSVASVASFSNPIIKQLVYGNIVGVVRKPNLQPLAGAVVSAGGFNATTNAVGAYSLQLPVGVYTVTCTATGYETATYTNISVIADQNTTLNIVMAISDNDDVVIPVVATALSGNHPNPFNPETVISYAVKDPCNVRLEVYNLKGQRVRGLVKAYQNTGHYRVVFDAHDDSGMPLSSGVYLYRFTAGSYTSTRKMMLME